MDENVHRFALRWELLERERENHGFLEICCAMKIYKYLRIDLGQNVE